eukprot:60860-Pyramimonas_sp.AAC.2
MVRPHAHPWAVQFQDDLEALKELEAGETMWNNGGGMKHIMFEDYEDFIKVDCDELRAKLRTTPTTSTRKQAHHEGKFICKETLTDGTTCNTAWSTQHMLTKHIVNAVGGSHGQLHVGRILTTTNMCVLCDSVFLSAGIAKKAYCRQPQTPALSVGSWEVCM